MKKIFPSESVYLAASNIPNAGRGVFAAHHIKKNKIIERCPIIEVPKNDTSVLSESILVTYFFFFGKKKERMAISLGFGSIYNHSGKPNATFKINPENTVIDFIAIKNIKKDTEITFNYYHGNTKGKSPLWFEAGAPDMFFFVYILRTSKNTLYIGQTNNLEKRLQEHKSKSPKAAKYTRSFDSVKLVYSESYKTRKEAMQREIELKGWTKKKKEALVH